jgi:uncharacterized membrane protein
MGHPRNNAKKPRKIDKEKLGPVLGLHVLWFGVWVTVNSGMVGGIRPFDPFPFPFLTMTVSLEAIFLALFVLASQHRLSRQADKRSHLDLQIDLLAEREMTAVLQLLQDIASHPPRQSNGRVRKRSTSLDRLAPFEDDCVMVVIETRKGSLNKENGLR